MEYASVSIKNKVVSIQSIFILLCKTKEKVTLSGFVLEDRRQLSKKGLATSSSVRARKDRTLDDVFFRWLCVDSLWISEKRRSEFCIFRGGPIKKCSQVGRLHEK